jgi:peptidoglycan/xylan/chitin deacetylase (PgdA/CDA1 family)
MKLSGKKVIYPFYHYVEELGVKNELTSNLYKVKNIKEFTADLSFLKKNFKSISFEDLTGNNISKTNFSFLLSFDDGLSNFTDLVSPILEKENIFAINFINTNFIDNKELFYRYKINLLIDLLRKAEPTIEQQEEICNTLNYKRFNAGQIVFYMKGLCYEDISLIDTLSNILKLDITAFLSEKKPYLSKEQIEKLIEKGFHFGAHSASHPHYSEIKYEVQIKETIESINHLKNEFGFKKVPFAFPFSDKNVSLDFFNFLKPTKQLTFGTAGIKDEMEGVDNIQRIPMELEFSKHTAETIIKGELILYIFKKKLGRHLIFRNMWLHK